MLQNRLQMSRPVLPRAAFFFFCNNIYHYEVLFILVLVVSVKHHTSYTFYYFMIYSLIHVLVHSFVFHVTGGRSALFSRCVCVLLMFFAVAILAQVNKAPTCVTKIYIMAFSRKPAHTQVKEEVDADDGDTLSLACGKVTILLFGLVV